MPEYSPHDPRDVVRSRAHPTPCLVHTAADRQTSSEVQRGVALQPLGLACLCVTFLLVVLVPWVGEVGH